MATAQIEVISLNGELFLVRDGNLEPVSEGQILEVLAESANLVVGEASEAVVMVNGNEFELGANASLEIPLSDELAGDSTEQSLAEQSVDDLLQALETDQDLLELVEEPAAGAEGGEGGDGHGFVRLLRISETINDIDPVAPAFTSASDPDIFSEFVGTDATEQSAVDESNGGSGDEGDTSTNATVAITDQGGEETINGEGETATITGSIGANGVSLDSLVITDGNNGSLTVDLTGVTPDANGDYTVTDVDVSSLADGQLEVTASSTDDDGNTAAPTDTVTLDAAAPTGDNVETNSELFVGEVPDNVTPQSPLVFKQFSVDGIIDGSGLEPSPTLGGSDAETALDSLTFTLETLPGSGTLFIDADGDGTHTEAQQGDEFSHDATLYWLDDGSGSNTVNLDFSQAPAADSGVTLYAYGYDGEKDNTLLNYGNDGVGVEDDSAEGIQQQVSNQLGYRDGKSQTLVMDFEEPAHDVEVSISRLIKDEGEVGQVEAYLDGEQVGSWTFSGVNDATLDGEPVDFNIGGSSGSFNLPEGLIFDQLRFTATEYADGYQSDNDSSEYFVDSISYKAFSPAEFQYSVKDEAGNQSDPVSVAINTPQASTNVPDAFDVSTPPEIISLLDGDGLTVNEAFLDNGTRAGETPEAGESVTTANGQFSLSASVGIGTLSIAAASLTTGDAAHDASNGVVTLTESQLKALSDASPVTVETPEGNVLSLTGYDAETGVVDYTFTLTGAVTNVDGQSLDKAPIELELTDVNGISDQATINITVLDDNVNAVDDLFAAVGGDPATGNALENDSGADVDLELASVTFEGTTHRLPEDGTTIDIDGNNGTLTVDRSGNYSYQANTIEPVSVSGNSLSAWQSQTSGLWGFTSDSSIPLSQGSNLLVGDLGDGNDAVVFNNGSKSGLGVPDGAGKIDDGESLLIHLNGPTNSASVGINQFNASQSELGLWNAYAENGVLVGSGSFGGVNSNGVRFELSIETDASFTYLQLGLDTGDINSNTGFVIDEVTSTPSQQFEQDDFTYTAVDQDGSTTDGSLSAFAVSDDLNPVIGSEGDDTLNGTDVHDALIGGAGDDTLIGGLGDDVFKWTLVDKGDADTPANDVIKDFGKGNDVLDLRDLLVGETEQSISQFLSVSEDGDDLIFQVTHDGGDGGATQSIRLEGKSFSDFQVSNADELIQNMIDNGQLNIDS